jgi:EmrB/QacA subfamily drug resistance transporter
MTGPQRLPCEIPPPHAPPAPERQSANRWVLPATVLGSSLGFIDGSVVNVALPAITRETGASFGGAQWVINGYMLTFASMILLGGSASDRFGRRRAFLWGLFGFVAASVACGLAPSPAALVACRLAQGVAAALLVPASLAIIGSAFSGEARGRAIGTWAAAGALTTALGPALGGWLVDAIGWRAIFFINLPIGAAAILLGLRLPADSGSAVEGPLDVAGAALAVLALGLLSYGLIALGEGGRFPAAVALVAAVPALVLFLRREARAPAPMMPLSLFGSRDFAGANALTVLLYAALSGALFLLPFLLIGSHGYSAAAAGAAFLPFSAILGFGSRRAGALAERLGARKMLVAGPALTGAGFLVLGLSGGISSYWSGVLPGLLVAGIGMTLAVAPLTATVFASVPDEMSGAASAINNAAARSGGLVAVAAIGLAFGGAAAVDMEPEAVTRAYGVVMFAASGLAFLSAMVAAVTISPRRDPMPEAGTS